MRKRHVLIEKPIAKTVADGREVLDVCREEGVLAATGFMMRFHAYHQVMREMIADGKLGQVVSCRAQLTCWYPEIPGAWRQVQGQSGGGAVMDNGANCMVDVNFSIPDAAGRGRFEIYGTKGSMLAEGTIGQVEGGKLDVMISDDSLAYDAKQNHNDVAPLDVQVEFGNMYTKEIESFCDSIMNGTAIEVPAEEVLQVQRIVEFAYEVARKGAFMKV